MKKVLITGIAGFIGFHLAQKLHELGHQVFGLDNFNDYYDPALKKARHQILKEKNIAVTKLDISDAHELHKFCDSNEYDVFIHLAAQAGVRYSLENPDAYVQSNLVGFVNVLEVCRKKPNIPLIFASSSSVYGLNKSIPFSEKDRVDNPVSLYGATKKSNEVLAFSYHELFKIPMIGLRFFTVYGPYGRPDMAYFSFTQKILSGNSIDVFNQGDLQRDFTYVDDIVKGIVSCTDIQASFNIYNLGNNQPQRLDYFISCLEKHLGKKASKNFLPMQKGDVYQTYANIDKAQADLNFLPQVSLDEGLGKFVAWYKNFYSI